jgi:DNA invertase Pin-like site-specific DNA recombinase
MSAALPMDLYRRVSRRNGREGDTYHSPAIQLEAGEQWARLNGVAIGKVPPPEEDVSGAVEVANRELERLLERVEAGVSAGIITYKADRFARDTIETLVAAKRLKEAGGRLVGVSDGVDSATPGGQTTLALMATMAEQHLENIKGTWKRVTGRAVANGVHIACRAPSGYLRVDQVTPTYDSKGELIRDGRLAKDPDVAPVVARMFEMKGEGASLGQMRAHFMRETGRPIAKSTISSMLKNRAYLGEARGPHGAVCAGAHEAIVTERAFDRAQNPGKATPRNGTLADRTALSGLVVCDACDHRMAVVGSTLKAAKDRAEDERIPTYACTGQHGSGDCPAPAAIQARKLDPHIANVLRDSADEAAASVASEAERFLVARDKAKEAEGALDAWVDDPTIATTIGNERFQRGLVARQEALTEAKRALWDLDDPGIEDGDVVYIGGRPVVYESWGRDPAADRRHVGRFIREVRVARADPKRRRTQPIEERVTVQWIGAGDAAEPVAA